MPKSIAVRTTLIAAMLLICPISAHSGSLTFPEAIERALNDNPGLRAMKHSVLAGREDIGIARSSLLPKIRFEERFLRTDNPTIAFSSKLNQSRFSQSDFDIESLNTPAEINDFQSALTIEQAVFARKANIGLKLAKNEYEAQLEALERKKEEVALQALEAFLKVNTASELADAAQKGVTEAAEHLRIAELRHSQGLGLYSDVLRAKTEFLKARQTLISAQKVHNISKKSLGLLLGSNEVFDISGPAPELKMKEREYYEAAAGNRKDIKSLRLRNENARQSIKISQAGYLPTIGLGGTYQANGNEAPFSSQGDSWTVSAFLKWDVFDGNLRKHEAGKARHQALAAARDLDGFEKLVLHKVYVAHENAIEAKENLSLANNALEAAEEGMRLIRTRYENALSPLIDLIGAENALQNTRANAIARKNEYSMALAVLAFESGLIFEELDKEVLHEKTN